MVWSQYQSCIYLRAYVNVRSLFIAFSLLLISAETTKAQWTNVAPQLLLNSPRNEKWGGAIASYSSNVWTGIYSLYLSNDSGKTWVKREPSFKKNEFVHHISCFDKNTVLIILSIFEGNYFSSRLMITYDEGLSWKEIYSGGYRLTSATFLRTRNEIIATRMRLPGDAHVIRTFDGGLSWLVDPSDGGTLDVKFNKSNEIILLTSYPDGWTASIRKSTDNGYTWTPFRGNLNYDCYSIELDKCDPNVAYVVDEEIWAGGRPPRVYRVSSDGLYVHDYSYYTYFPKLSGSLSTSRSAVFAHTLDSGVIRSTDLYQPWVTIGGPNGLPDSRLLLALTNNTIICVGDDGSIWRTTNCGGKPIVVDADLKARLTDVSIDTIGQTVSIPVYFEGPSAPLDATITFSYDTSLRFMGCYTYSGSLLPELGVSSPSTTKITIAASDMRPGEPSCYLRFEYPISRETPYVVTLNSIDYPGKQNKCANLEDEPLVASITPLKGCGINLIEQYMFYQSLPSIQIQPNPLKDNFTITAAKDVNDVSILVTDVNGVISQKMNISLKKGVPQNVNVQSLPSGMYFVLLSTATSRTSKRIIIER